MKLGMVAKPKTHKTQGFYGKKMGRESNLELLDQFLCWVTSKAVLYALSLLTSGCDERFQHEVRNCVDEETTMGLNQRPGRFLRSDK